MTIETELTSLVTIYASYNEENKCYSSALNKETLLRLDSDFIKLINKLLLIEGPEKAQISRCYKKLALYFHTDHITSFNPETLWLEKNLSEGRNDGACFRTLRACYGKLTSPQDFKPIKFEEISSREDLKKWLEKLLADSRTFTERNLYASLLGLLKDSTGYFDEVGKIKSKGVKSLISFLPIVFISFGTIVFAEELFAVYALYFALLKGGQYIGTSKSRELKMFGDTLQKISVITATATTTLLARLIEMTFWTSRQCYDISLKIGSVLLSPLITFPSLDHSTSSEWGEGSLCKDLILASHNDSTRYNFKTPQLKMIAAPIESYIGLLEQQLFRNWRAGGGKYRALEAFLFRMRVIDKDDELDLKNKVSKTYEALNKVKKDSSVYTVGGNTASAVDRAERVIHLLQVDCTKQVAPMV